VLRGFLVFLASCASHRSDDKRNERISGSPPLLSLSPYQPGLGVDLKGVLDGNLGLIRKVGPKGTV
jgi:hypothetical protein